MKRLTSLVLERPPAGWALAVAAAALVAGLLLWGDQQFRAHQRLALLQTESERSSVEIMSATLNGDLMGAVSLLGLMDANIKAEADKWVSGWDAAVVPVLALVGEAFGADGVFVVGRDGVVASSWDKAGKSSTGVDVRFRPYYQMAMKGQTNIYAAVSMARGDRSLYFTAPVFAQQAREPTGMGAVVARTALDRVDKLLARKADGALLLSPQGIVFAASRADWVGRLAGEATPQRLAAIRALKQFGAQFETQAPTPLPLDLAGGFKQLDGKPFALATAPVDWHDPSGDWTLVLLEDLSRTVPWQDGILRAALAGLLTLLLARMLLQIARSRQVQQLAAEQLQAYADQQQRQVDFRKRLGELSQQMQAAGDLEQLALAFFRHAREMVGAVQGALYVARATGGGSTLHLAGCSACAEPPPRELALGEGLLGQCALDGRAQLIETPSEGIWNLRSGLGGTRAAALLILPLSSANGLIGVLELGLLRLPGTEARQEMDDLAQLLTSHLDSARRHALRQEPQAAAQFTEKAQA